MPDTCPVCGVLKVGIRPDGRIREHEPGLQAKGMWVPNLTIRR